MEQQTILEVKPQLVDEGHHHDDKHGYYGQPYKKRKGSIIGELFDF